MRFASSQGSSRSRGSLDAEFARMSSRDSERPARTRVLPGTEEALRAERGDTAYDFPLARGAIPPRAATFDQQWGLNGWDPRDRGRSSRSVARVQRPMRPASWSWAANAGRAYEAPRALRRSAT